MMQMQWIVKDRDVSRALINLEMLMSSAGLSAFLGTQVAPYLKMRAGERFASEGDDVTGPWAPLKPATVAIREASHYQIGGAHPINRRSGELEDWVTQGNYDAYPTGFGAALQYPDREPSGELRDKLETAQKGRKSPNTVKRPVLGVNEKDLLFVITALAANVEAATK